MIILYDFPNKRTNKNRIMSREVKSEIVIGDASNTVGKTLRIILANKMINVNI